MVSDLGRTPTLREECGMHSESGEELWVQGEAVLQTLSSRDAKPQPVIAPYAKKNYEMSPRQLRTGINISLTPKDPFVPSTAWQCSDVCYSKSS